MDTLTPPVALTPPAPTGAPVRATHWWDQRSPQWWAPRLATAACVLGVIVVTLWQVHLNLLFRNTATTGGDTGAHFMTPAFIRSQLLSHGHLTGWDPDWYDGYPIYTYYFVLPDLLVALASFVIHYDVAFKFATVMGSLLLPVCAWSMGRMFGLRRPIPAAMAAATLCMLFEQSFTIYGGNLFSTLAGEYAYSLSLSLALLFIGICAKGVRTGRWRAFAAITLALCIAAHFVPAFLALAGAGLLTAIEFLPGRIALSDAVRLAPGRRLPAPERGIGKVRALWWSASSIGVALLVAGWWLVPFGLRQDYATQMGYTNPTDYRTLFFPECDLWAIVLGAIAVVVAFALRSRFGITFSILGALSALALVIDPQGGLYNVRLLPFWFICLYLMVGWLVGVSAAALARLARRIRHERAVMLRKQGHAAPLALTAVSEPGAVFGALAALIGALLVVIPPFIFPAADLPVHVGVGQVSGWAEGNYVGYQGQASWPEYHSLMDTMGQVGRHYGCGRAMWEYSPNLNRFGTTMAPMLLPYWTGGCIDSMEGLFFESSATTPYHFLNQAELSAQPSEPMVGLDYSSVNVPLGVEHLQMLGVRYFMASSTEVETQAALDPELRQIASSGPWSSAYGVTTWKIYEVLDAPIVQSLPSQPAVLTGVTQNQTGWLPPSENWYLNPAAWNVELAADGPKSWQRVSVNESPRTVDEPEDVITDVSVNQNNGDVSFHADRTGVPVLVKVSYFPNWRVSGARGPYRVTPNLMVVIPTSHNVALTYGTTPANDVGIVATTAGVVALFVLFRRRRALTRSARPSIGLDPNS